MNKEGSKNSSKMSKKRCKLINEEVTNSKKKSDDFSREEISGGNIAEKLSVIFLW